MVKSFDIKKDVPNDTSYNLRIYKRLSDATILVCFQDDSNRNDISAFLLQHYVAET